MAEVKIARNELKPGDHIYSWVPFHLNLYAHHGIYVGEGKVIHFTSGAGQGSGSGIVSASSSSSSSPLDYPCPSCGYHSRSDGVISSCLECFLPTGGEIYLFQYGVSSDFHARARGGTCSIFHSDPPEEVLHRAKSLLENGFGNYNLFMSNCENFAIYCKTGSGGLITGQAESFLVNACWIC